MTRRGNTRKSVVKDLPTAPIIKKIKEEKDEKGAVTTVTPSRIMRIPYSELRGKTKANTARRASVTRASSATLTKCDKLNITTAKSVEISPDVSDYYLTDEDDTDSSDEDCGPQRHKTNEYDEIRKKLTMISSFEGTAAYVYTDDYSDYMRDMFASSSESDGDLYDSDNDSSEAERIMIELMNAPVTSSVFVYASRVTGYLRNFQNTATPVVRARIQDFIRSMDSTTIHYSNLANAVADFKIELSELTGDPLTDFPAFDFEGSTITKKRSGLSEVQIASLPRHSYLEAENDLNEPPHKCCICMSEFQKDEELISLEKCSHQFHSGCLESWLRKADQCPICREVVK